ncbi:MAG: DsbE family thiol:disulfide interchange protein [Hyphomicrobiales bacterium]|nr:DsbE family thiol:disulfide interchange protein [Hyphomicrobiales bacterium]
MKPLVFAPLAIVVALSGLFAWSLLRGGDPALVPSPLINKPTPAFNLPAVPGLASVPGLSSADLRRGHVTVVNYFASWCLPCRAENPLLLELAHDKDLAAKGVKLVGLDYKDEPAAARSYLKDDGNPYAAIGDDSKGLTFINWGSYGVPETYVVRGDGIIAYKLVGPLDPAALKTKLIPHIEAAMKQG